MKIPMSSLTQSLRRRGYYVQPAFDIARAAGRRQRKKNSMFGFGQ